MLTTIKEQFCYLLTVHSVIIHSALCQTYCSSAKVMRLLINHVAWMHCKFLWMKDSFSCGLQKEELEKMGVRRSPKYIFVPWILKCSLLPPFRPVVRQWSVSHQSIRRRDWAAYRMPPLCMICWASVWPEGGSTTCCHRWDAVSTVFLCFCINFAFYSPFSLPHAPLVPIRWAF